MTVMKRQLALLLFLMSTGTALATHGYVECEVDVFAAKGSNNFNSGRLSEIEQLKRRISVNELSHMKSLKGSANIGLEDGVAVTGKKMKINYSVSAALGPEHKELYVHTSGRNLELFLEVDGMKAQSSGTILDGGNIATSIEVNDPGWFSYKVTSVRLLCKLNN
jgi:hypothetical protein